MADSKADRALSRAYRRPAAASSPAAGRSAFPGRLVRPAGDDAVASDQSRQRPYSAALG